MTVQPFMRRRQRIALEREARLAAVQLVEPPTMIERLMVTQAIAGMPVEVFEPATPPRIVQPAQTVCPKCGKTMKKRGAHFHIRSCKGEA